MRPLPGSFLADLVLTSSFVSILAFEISQTWLSATFARKNLLLDSCICALFISLLSLLNLLLFQTFIFDPLVFNFRLEFQQVGLESICVANFAEVFQLNHIAYFILQEGAIQNLVLEDTV